MKKLTAALLLTIIITAAPIIISAKPIEGEDVYERAFNAGYDIYELITFLIDNYVGDEITVEQLYDAALRGMGYELDENSEAFTESEYQEFIDEYNSDFEGIGVYMLSGDITLINEVIEGSPADKAGVKAGDLITKINGVDASKKSANDISLIIRSSKVKTVNLEVKRGDKTLRFNINKANVHAKSVRSRKIEELLPNVKANDAKDIRLISVSAFGEETAAEFESIVNELKAEKVKYIIIDLRGNGGGIVEAAEEMAKLILPEGAIYSYHGADNVKETVYSILKKPPFEHIAVLTDYYTASASEILASALKDAGIATVVGQNTYGKGSFQIMAETLTGGAFKFTVAEFLRRNGEKVNKIGIAPDIIIPTPRYIEDYAENESQAPDIIKEVRDVLSYLDYKLDRSLTYNSAIIVTIKKFQASVSLEETGIPDYDTVTALNGALFEKQREKDRELEAAYKLLKER